MPAGFYTIDELADDILVTFPNPNSLMFSSPQARYIADHAPLAINLTGRGGGKGHITQFEKLSYGFPAYFARALGHTPHHRAGSVWQINIFAPTQENYNGDLDMLWSFLPRVPGRNQAGEKNFQWREEDQEFHLFGRNQFVVKLISLYSDKNAQGGGADDNLIDEAQEIKKDVWDQIVRPMIFRPFYTPRCAIAGIPGGPTCWLDQAFMQASDPEHYPGYFNGWSAYSWSSYESPGTTPELAHAYDKERTENYHKWLRQRMALPMVTIPADSQPDTPISPAMLACALEPIRMALTGTALVVWDLFYGGDDWMIRGVWDKSTASLIDLRAWTRDDFKFNIQSPDWRGHIGLFEDTARQFPGCTQCFDLTGPYGSKLAPHLPAHINAIPIVRNNTIKNQHVSDLLHRLEHRDSSGRSIGIRLPDPERYPFTSEKQREWMRIAKEQIIHYREISETKTGHTNAIVRYTKGDGFGDDFVDMITMACSRLPHMNAAPVSAVQGNLRALRRFQRS